MFVDLASFIRSIIALCPDLSFAKFLAKLQYHAINARVKDDFFEHVKRALQSMEKELGI